MRKWTQKNAVFEKLFMNYLVGADKNLKVVEWF